MAKVMREKVRHYLNTNTTGSPVWSLINEGVSSLTTNFNPESEEEAYIADAASTKYTTGLAVETTFDMNRVKGDLANDAIFLLVWGRKIGTDADSELLTVNYSAPPANTDQYPAIKDTINIIYNSLGDEAVKPLKIGVTLGHQGDPVVGTYDVSDAAFTPTA
jgi:hypothetical protein